MDLFFSWNLRMIVLRVKGIKGFKEMDKKRSTGKGARTQKFIYKRGSITIYIVPH